MSRLFSVAATFWIRRLRYPWSRLRRAMFERGYLDEPLPEVDSVESIGAALRQVTWTADGPLHLYDAISYPQTTWRKKHDDCDGFATLAAALLRELNADTDPVLLTTVVLPLKKAHTVCAFRDESGTLRIFDNARLRPQSFDSYVEVARVVAQRGESAVCWDVVDPESLRVLEFHRGPSAA